MVLRFNCYWILFTYQPLSGERVSTFTLPGCPEWKTHPSVTIKQIYIRPGPVCSKMWQCSGKPVTGSSETGDEPSFLPGNTLKYPIHPNTSSLVPLWYLFGTSESGEAKRYQRGTIGVASRITRRINRCRLAWVILAASFDRVQNGVYGNCSQANILQIKGVAS